MHTCPDCGQACTCEGDIESHDIGEEFTAGCTHFMNKSCEGNEIYNED